LSKVLCTFGFGSIDRSGARADVQSALDSLHCIVRWEGGIPPNPEYDRLIEIVAVVNEFKPDLLLAVGGGSPRAGTPCIAIAAGLDPGKDPWKIMSEHDFSGTPYPFGAVMTLPATGSEWNPSFVISRHSINAKMVTYYIPASFPKFSLIDPRYTATLPPRQLRNGVFDAIVHVIDQFLTEPVALFDDFFLAVFKELVTIGREVVKMNSPIELRERLILAALFALNMLFMIGKESCWGIHKLGSPITVKYGIDHGAALAIVAVPFLKLQKEARKEVMAKAAQGVFGINTGTIEERAEAFIQELGKFAVAIGQPTKVSDWEGAVIGEGDVEDLVTIFTKGNGAQPVGWKGCVSEQTLRTVLSQVLR
jgi:alcohol dehydrogenase YqhD (iron-dependent ADH family)